MYNTDSLCMGCFSQLTDGEVCLKCGFDNNSENESTYLPLKFLLEDRYIVGKVVEHSTDGATYMGYDTQLKSVVFIREFLPKGIANRLEGATDVHVRERAKSYFEKTKDSFLQMWRTISKLRNLNAVSTVYDVFEENGTAYSISEYMESVSLRQFLLKNPNGLIDWKRARVMLMPVLTTIERLHENGIIHGAICPDNLILCGDGKVRLTGFMINEATTLPTEMSFKANDGYMAIEQYDNNYKIGPWTDIYAFNACIYRTLVGNTPPDAQQRAIDDKLMIPNSVAEQIPVYVIKAMGNGLQIYTEKRTKTVYDLREQLSAAPSIKANADYAPAAPVKEPSVDDFNNAKKIETPKTEEKKEDNKEKTTKIVIAILVALIVVAIAAGVLITQTDIFKPAEETTVSTTIEQVDVPDFSTAGYTKSDIENSTVWNDNFAITFTTQYSSDVEEGLVFKQSVTAGTTVDKKTAITLTVSKGPHTETIPDVGGLSSEDAEKTLTKLGFTVSTLEVYNDGSHTEGIVKSTGGMSPAAGTKYEVGKEIKIQIYGEVATTTEPETTTGLNEDNTDVVE